MIDLDATFFLQFVNFIITLVVLNFILIKPIRGIIAQRKIHMSDLVGSAETFTADADEKLKNYKKQLDEARQLGTEKRTELKNQGAAQEKTILSSANQEAASSLKSAREAVDTEMTSALSDLKAQVESLAGQVTAKVLS